MSNAEIFLNTYNEIDRILKNIDKEDYQTFSSKVRNSNNPIIRQFKDKLLDFGELRNAIVHNPKIGSDYIAEPHSNVVNEFKSILEKLKNPKKVIPLFQFHVEGAKTSERIDRMLRIMKNEKFSQFPAFDENGNVVELINTNTICNWLGNQIEENEIMTENPTIQELIDKKHIEFPENYDFISRDCDVYTAYDYFVQRIKKFNRNLDCLFITQTGSKKEKLLGLITIADIADKV